MTDDILDLEDKFSPGDVLGIRYEVLKYLGKGAVGHIYLINDRILDINLALKILDEEHNSDKRVITRFYTEAKIGTLLKHNNINRFYHIDKIGDRHCITMEYVGGEKPGEKGKTLEEIIDEKVVFEPEEAWGIVRQILKGFIHAHNYTHKEKGILGIIHRDINPTNIMMTGDGTVKIMDFGIGKILQKEGTKEEGLKTADDAILGTAQYTSPEQIRAYKINGKTDVFSTAIILYEMLTGRLPFGNKRIMDVQEARGNILREKVKILRRFNNKIPVVLEKIVLKALDKDPDQRYSAEELYNAYSSFIEGKNVKVEGSVKRRISLFDRRDFVKAGITSGILIGIGGGSGLTKYLIDYHTSMYPILKDAQASETKTWEKLVPILVGLFPKIVEKVSWLNKTQISKTIDSERKKKLPAIYPIGSVMHEAWKGKYGFVFGTGSNAGSTCGWFHNHSKALEIMASLEKNPKKQRELLEESRRAYYDFVFASTHLHLEKRTGKEGHRVADEETRIVHRHHEPAVIAKTEVEPKLKKITPFTHLMIKKIMLNQAESQKISIEKIIPYTLTNLKGGEKEMGFWKDSGITEMLCDGFRISNLKDDVLTKYEVYGESIKNETQFLNLIIHEADEKIKHCLNDEEWIKNITTKDYVSFMHGLAHREGLIRNIIAEKDTKYNQHDVFIKNISNLDININYLINKGDEYAQWIHYMGEQYLSSLPDSGIPHHFMYQAKDSVNPPNILPLAGFLGVLRESDKPDMKIKNMTRDELRLITYQALLIPEIVCVKKKDPPSIKDPFGIFKGTIVNISHNETKGATNMEFDTDIYKDLFQIYKEYQTKGLQEI